MTLFSIPNKVLTPLVKQRFLEWVTVILVDHDQADIGES